MKGLVYYCFSNLSSLQPTVKTTSYVITEDTHICVKRLTNNIPYHAQSALFLLYSFFRCRFWPKKLISQPSNESLHTLVSRGVELGLYPKVSRKPLNGFKPSVIWSSFLCGNQRVGCGGSEEGHPGAGWLL